MSGKKKPSTALVRVGKVPSDEALAAGMDASGYALGCRKVIVNFSVSVRGAEPVIEVVNPRDARPGASYLIYDTGSRAFVGICRSGDYKFEGGEGPCRLRLLFYPAARA